MEAAILTMQNGFLLPQVTLLVRAIQYGAEMRRQWAEAPQVALYMDAAVEQCPFGCRGNKNFQQC